MAYEMYVINIHELRSVLERSIDIANRGSEIDPQDQTQYLLDATSMLNVVKRAMSPTFPSIFPPLTVVWDTV